ncbi:MAG: cellulase family glycosylhydrolase [Bacteroidia bacterium]|nr:cellulase family glycosylhydrolase [Bacteroidia bacterium]
MKIRKTTKHFPLFIFTVIIVMLSTSCSKGKTDVVPNPVISDPIFTVTPDTYSFTDAGGTGNLTITMNGSKWEVTSDQTWCTLSLSTSSKASDQVIITTTSNSVKEVRTAKLTFIMDKKTTVFVNVTQDAKKASYPDYSYPIAADATGMSSNAKVLAAKMFAGWNLGNSLEVPGSETAWGNPKTTQTLIDSIKAAGINAIRIPCAWNGYIEDAATCKLSAVWLTRVKEVVDYCFKNNMYVIINIHWDGGWLEENPTYAAQDAVNLKQKALWEQIAVYFRGYDEHLLFAGTNEVHTSTNAASENFKVQMSYNQTFVNAVRSTGGKNAYRNLVIQSYNTNIDQAVSDLVVSTDAADSRLMVEVHYYDPWEFCGLEADAAWATIKYLWGVDYAQYGPIASWGQLAQFQKMKTSFVNKGYPVILGEYGAMRRSSLTGSTLVNHLASRAYYMQYIAQQAKQYGLVPFVWDNGATGNNGMGIFNRNNGSVFDKQALKAYITGATNGKYPY